MTDAANIALTRHIMAHWPDLSWWPAWDCGTPFAYPPLLPTLAALIAVVLDLPAERAWVILNAVLLSACPWLVYAIAVRVSRLRYQSFWFALISTAVLTWLHPLPSRIDYGAADWFDQNMRGARVMVPPQMQSWLQVFTETPQVGGGAHVRQADSLLLLKALGVHAVETSDGKFRGVLAEYWREGEHAIYRVPQRNNSLAHVMRAPHLEDLRSYVDAVDDPGLPEAQFVWRTQHSAEILTHAQPNHIVSVQITYHPGWQAQANGRDARVFRDGLGFLAIEPHCNGECRIELVYDGGVWSIWTLISRKRLFTGS
jgi:hypothetical protein